LRINWFDENCDYFSHINDVFLFALGIQGGCIPESVYSLYEIPPGDSIKSIINFDKRYSNFSDTDSLKVNFSTDAYPIEIMSYEGFFNSGYAYPFAMRIDNVLKPVEVDPRYAYAIEYDVRDSTKARKALRQLDREVRIIRERLDFSTGRPFRVLGYREVFEVSDIDLDLLTSFFETTNSRINIYDRNSGYLDGFNDSYIQTFRDHLKHYRVDDNSGTVDINEATTNLPSTFSIDKIHPNPFDPSTTVQYSVPDTREVTIQVFNILGYSVINLPVKRATAGTHSQLINFGQLPSGIYFTYLSDKVSS